ALGSAGTRRPARARRSHPRAPFGVLPQPDPPGKVASAHNDPLHNHASNKKGRRDMSEAERPSLSRREFVHGAAAGAALASAPGVVLAASANHGADKAAVLSKIKGMHEANVKRLQEWIALPSIAAEDRNYPQGAQHMAKLAESAGFTGVKLIPTPGKPGVF